MASCGSEADELDWVARQPKEHTCTHGGYILLQLALERRYGTAIDELIEQRILRGSA